ncbi:MAG: hypothetical protein VCD33_16155, partial [Alphaproteobacteria bacterium]
MEPVVARLYGQDAIAEIEKTSLGKITSFKDGKTLKQREQFVHRAGDKILLTEDEQRRVDAEKKIQSALSKGQLVASVKSVSAGELTVPPEYWKDKDRWMTLYTGLLRWEKGVFVADEAKTGIFGTIERRKVDKIFLEGLDEHSQSGRDLSASPNAGNYA